MLSQNLDQPRRKIELVQELKHSVKPASVDAEEAERKPDKRTDVMQMGLSRLPVEERITVVLADVQSLGYGEIAETVGVTQRRVRRRLARARAKLRDYLRARGQLPPTEPEACPNRACRDK